MATSTIRPKAGIPAISQRSNRLFLQNLHREVVTALATEQLSQEKWEDLTELRDRIRSRLELLDTLNGLTAAAS